MNTQCDYYSCDSGLVCNTYKQSDFCEMYFENKYIVVNDGYSKNILLNRKPLHVQTR